ncbi:MAG: hypothetical protein AAF657_08430 [Acidobacteriota bacterium]
MPRLNSARNTLALLLLIFAPFSATFVQAQPVCPLPVEPPVASLPFERPTEAIVTPDHRFVHSATHLQGQPAREKWAPGLIHRPAGTDIDEMTSAVVIDNPFDTPVTFTLTYFNHLGVDTGSIIVMPPAICLPRTITLAAEATHVEAATPLDPAAGCGAIGVGSARITVAAASPNGIVGSVLHHTGEFFGGLVTDPDPTAPGAGAMEQLQVPQTTDRLLGGPFPLTFSATEAVLNGMAPMIAVLNPNPTAVVVALDLIIFDAAAGTTGTLPFRPLVIIPAQGTLLEVTGPHLTALAGAANPGLWQNLLFTLLSSPGIDLDVSVQVRYLGSPQLPIMGSFIATDFIGDEVQFDSEFRMASGMLQSTPSVNLMSPELSFQVIEHTDILLGNPGAVASDFTITYRSNTGVALSTFTGTLPAGNSIRIVPGAFGYPAAPVGFGWVQINSCEPLFGWTVREIVDDPSVPFQYHKAYGEVLMNTQGAEPGSGFTVGGMTRKAVSIARVGGGWPGYSTAINNSVSNTLAYSWPFFDLGGTSCGANSFTGLPYAFASWTLEDPQAPLCSGNVSGRIDVTVGTVDGISISGDPYREWGIPDFGTDPM